MSYNGPIEPGMIFSAPGNDGKTFRRDLVLGAHPFKPDIILLEALPCKMRSRLGSGVGEIIQCPEVNLRLISSPEPTNKDDAT